MVLKRYSSLIALVIIIAFLYGMDRFLDYQSRVASRELTIKNFIFLTFTSHVILLIVWLVLYWITFVWGKPNPIVGIIFLIAGFVMIIFPIIQITIRGVPFLFTAYNTNLQYTAIYMAFLGILLLT